jgi:hypothetical protein
LASVRGQILALSDSLSIDPLAYSSLDAYTFRDGVHLDLPVEVIAAALERGAIPATSIATNHSRRGRRRHENGS